MPLGGEDGAKFFFALSFAGAHFAAAARVFVAADLMFSFGDDLGDFDAVAGGVDGDEGEVGGGDVAELLRANVFDHGFDADLHGGAEGAVDTGLEDKEIADADGSDEVEMIHRGGNDEGASVATRCHGAYEIHELHEAATEESAERIRVGREDNLAAFGL